MYIHVPMYVCMYIVFGADRRSDRAWNRSRTLLKILDRYLKYGRMRRMRITMKLVDPTREVD